MTADSKKPFSFKVNVMPFVVATFGEFVALYFWLWFFLSGNYILAVVLLLIGFLAERIAVLYWVSQVFGAEIGITGSKKTPLQKAIGLLMITGSEIIVWSLWFFGDRKLREVMDPTLAMIIASAILIVGEQLQHSWDLALLNQKKIKDFIFHPTAIFITALECGGGILMLYFYDHNQRGIAAGVMLLALTIEHVVQGSMIHPSAAPVQSAEPATV